MRLSTAETVLDFLFTKPSGTPAPSEGPLAALLRSSPCSIQTQGRHRGLHLTKVPCG
ncbi:hypothetical protein QBC35DRAFT_504895 [Podospora australis]|uniref:Uncharacterized protein n=1 Tax=Podospora australis TaxID=1536484 RepID=A0AAN7AGD3_9PEZI|nr:hypothetical protein QBC35DRAFT_504895 [Podospora australis]